MIINALLQEKARIAKVMFALRHLDKIVKHENGKEKRVPNVMTQSKIANKMNLTFQQIQKYEKAANEISSSKLFYLCKIFGYDINKFFAGNPRDLLGDINHTKHEMILKKWIEIDLNIQEEQKLQNKYAPMLPKLEAEMSYQNTFKG